VIVRQRPGTAKGFVFLSLEDETEWPTPYCSRLVSPQPLDVASERFLAIEGILQNQDNVISVKLSAYFRYSSPRLKPSRMIPTENGLRKKCLMCASRRFFGSCHSPEEPAAAGWRRA